MNIWKFKNWCNAAVDRIIFPPDRAAVHAELMNHLYDHYDDLVEQGVDKETAEIMALAAMGNAAEIAPQLAAIHRPFWGYFLRATRIILVLTLCAVVFCAGFWSRYLNDYATPDVYGAFDQFSDTHYSGLYNTQTRQFYAAPNQTVESDGYTLTLTQAALWNIYKLDNNNKNVADYNCFYFQIEVFNPLPWAAQGDVGRWIWGVDSLGNVYDCDYNRIINYAPYISCTDHHTAPLTYTYELWISDYRSQEAEWIEFHYDRSGRDLVWRVDLTGGDTP